ncbi:AAA family ATPase [Sinorhizobium meliloti]|uniref:AAA family ATPase n=1 Tax=Rhizobium meliloti TaxID=382 RepID=UPI001296C138|nr:AAA family ATPase [Sinorhizobium meliloti]MQX70073.1 AAA family ATPase [Sinorhizobium meliloti]
MTSLATIWSEGNRLVEEEAERLFQELSAKEPDPPPAPRVAASKAANDNRPAVAENPEHRARLETIQRDHGGTLRLGATGLTLFGVTIGGKTGQAFIADDGRAKLWNDKDIFPIEETPALPVLNPAEWEGRPIPERKWFVPGLIPARQVTILAGDGGVGKSLLALQLGAASAMSCETAGLSPAAGRVLYLGAEDEEEEFHRRLFDIVRAHHRSLSDLGNFRLVPMADADALLAIPDRSGVMQPTSVWRNFTNVAREFGPSLVVLDTVADLFGGDEIKRGQARQFIGMLRKLAIEIDAAIVLLAHPSAEGMRSGTGSSGSTGWKNSSRSMLYFTRQDSQDDADPNARVLATKKANYGKVGGELKLRWEDGVFVSDSGDASATIGILSRNAERIFVDLLRVFGRTGQNLGVTPGTNYAPSKMAKHPSAAGITKRSLEQAMQRLLEDDTIKLVWDGPPSKQRQRLIVSADDYGAKGGD